MSGVPRDMTQEFLKTQVLVFSILIAPYEDLWKKIALGSGGLVNYTLQVILEDLVLSFSGRGPTLKFRCVHMKSAE